jgi:hypothetical protein
MKKSSTQMIFGILGIAVTLGMSAWQPAIAQTSGRDANVYTNTQGGENQGSFGSSSSGDLGSMFDLFHRAVLGVPRSSSEFGREQQNSIGSEASDFRQRQQELLRQRQQGNVNAPNPQVAPVPGQSRGN